MKKLLLAIAAIGTAGLMNAQSSFTIVHQELGAVTSGQTLTFWVPITDANSNSYTLSEYFTVYNNTGSTVTTKVRKTELQMHDAAGSMWFCTDQNCYSPGTFVTPAAIPMTAGGGNFLLKPEFNTGATAGTGTARVRYTVFNVNNASDTAYFEIVYMLATGVGVNNLANVKPSISNPMPNPASAVFSIDFKVGNAGVANTKMVMYNMLGSKVREMDVNTLEGTMRFDVSDLEQGVYFCTLVSNGKQLATRRVMITR
jgi:hypothetical protein